MPLAKREQCTGCAACSNICPIDAIIMMENIEGFLYPQIRDDICIHCGKCESACPVLNKVAAVDIHPRAYIVQQRDERILMESTSGGAFSAIASAILEEDGAVYGAAFDNNCVVRHQRSASFNELGKFRGSKYVQSEIGKIFHSVMQDLEKGKQVCFSGTPCQVQGLLRFLGGNNEKLVTVDFVCHAVPSPFIFKKYISYQQRKYPQIRDIKFRDKQRGYSYSTMALYDANGNCVYRAGSELDSFFRLFLEGYCSRLSCYKCIFQSGYRPVDFTLWDCWMPSNYDERMDNNKGTTYVVAWTRRAQSIIEECRKYLIVKNIGMDLVEEHLTRRDYPMSNNNREKFFLDARDLDAKGFIEKYVPMGGVFKFKSLGRLFLYKVHLHDKIRFLVHWIRNIKRVTR